MESTKSSRGRLAGGFNRYCAESHSAVRGIASCLPPSSVGLRLPDLLIAAQLMHEQPLQKHLTPWTHEGRTQ
jgi:hypothetical protein